jgi:DNA gyrase subunit B
MPDPLQLSFLEHIRTRPGIYIGGANGRGLRHMIVEVIEEQVRAPGAKVRQATVTLLPDGFTQIECTGEAIADSSPPDFVPESAETAMSRLVSLAIASAMSDRLEAEVIRNRQRWSQHFSAGQPVSPATHESADGPDLFRIRYHPDPAIFRDARPSFLSLSAQIQEFAIFHPAVNFHVQDQDSARRDYQYPRRLLSYLEEVEHRWLETSYGMHLWRLELSDGPARAEAVIHHRGIGHYAVYSFVNGRRTLDGGTHITGFEEAFTEVATPHVGGPLNLFHPCNPILSGMTVLLAVDIPDPSWRYSTRDCLDGTYPRELVRRMVKEKLPPLIAATPPPTWPPRR